MPFQLHGAPATSQYLVNWLLGLCKENASADIDDVVEFKQTWAKHLQHLENVFIVLKETRLQLSKCKCVWLWQHLIFRSSGKKGEGPFDYRQDGGIAAITKTMNKMTYDRYWCWWAIVGILILIWFPIRFKEQGERISSLELEHQKAWVQYSKPCSVSQGWGVPVPSTFIVHPETSGLILETDLVQDHKWWDHPFLF